LTFKTQCLRGDKHFRIFSQTNGFLSRLDRLRAGSGSGFLKNSPPQMRRGGAPSAGVVALSK
jgi:hypothetical protein